MMAGLDLHQVALLFKVGDNALSCFIAVKSFVFAAETVYCCIVVHDADLFKIVALTDEEVVRVVSGSDLDAAGTEILINVIIGYDGDLSADERKDEKPRKKKVKATITKESTRNLEDATVLSLDIGKTSGTTRTDLVSHITHCAGITEDRIGRIGMGGSSSFVEIETSIAGEVLKAINGSKINGKKIRASFAPEKRRCKDKLADKGRK